MEPGHGSFSVSYTHLLNLIYDVAIHAAVEAIQLAAMVKKYERSQRHDWPGGWVPDYGTGPEPLKKKGGETV